MNYFKKITSLHQAKEQYRFWVKELHPDKGGSALEFHTMNQEYRQVLISLEHQIEQPTTTHALTEELKRMGLLLIKNKVPQKLLHQKAKDAESEFTQKLCKSLASILDDLIK